MKPYLTIGIAGSIIIVVGLGIWDSSKHSQAQTAPLTQHAELTWATIDFQDLAHFSDSTVDVFTADRTQVGHCTSPAIGSGVFSQQIQIPQQQFVLRLTLFDQREFRFIIPKGYREFRFTFGKGPYEYLVPHLAYGGQNHEPEPQMR